MPSQQPQIQSSVGSLDPQAVALSKAIRQTESNNNFTQKGKSGEYGAYQWEPATWDSMSKQAGVNVPLEQATPEQQNQVAYTQIKKWKDAGYNPGQIASMWNAGEGKPNAYLEGNKGTNAEGVQYDTAAYAKKVAEAYQQFKTQGGSTLNQEQNNQPKSLSDEVVGGIKSAGNFLFPILGDIGDDVSGKSKKNVVQQAADAALSALPFIPFAGEAGEAIRGAGLLGQVGLGAGAGALQGISQGQDASGVLGSAAMGGITGGALGGAGKVVGKLAEALPQSIVRKFIPGLSAEEAQYAASKPLGSISSMLSQSNKDVAELGSKLGATLKNPQYEYIQPSGEEIINKVIQAPQLQDAGLKPKDIATYLNKIVPLKKTLINKLVSGQDMTLTELHSLNSSLGKATFKRVFDDPTVRAGKDIGSVVYHTISDTLKTAAPESAPLFDNLSKEYALNSGLSKAARSAEKSKAIGLKEILAIMAGFGAGGPLGGAGAYALEKGITSPTVNLKTAGLVSKLASPTAGLVGSAVSPQISRGLVNLSSVNPASQ